MTDGNDYDEGMTALHLAAGQGSAATIKALVTARANLEARANDGWPTPLLWAVTQGSTAGVHELVVAGAKGQVFKAGDRPALSYAVEQGRLAMVRDLLKAGGRPNEPIGEGWQPPLHVALAHCGKLRGRQRQRRRLSRRSAARAGRRRCRSVGQGWGRADTCRGRRQAPG